MKRLYQPVVAALAAAAATLTGFWVAETVIPSALPITPDTTKVVLLLGILLASTVPLRGGQVAMAGAVLAGSGLAWALHAIDPISRCQSDLLFRPCTIGDVVVLAGPPALLLLACAFLFVVTVARTRPSS